MIKYLIHFRSLTLICLYLGGRIKGKGGGGGSAHWFPSLSIRGFFCPFDKEQKRKKAENQCDTAGYIFIYPPQHPSSTSCEDDVILLKRHDPHFPDFFSDFTVLLLAQRLHMNAAHPSVTPPEAGCCICQSLIPTPPHGLNGQFRPGRSSRDR